MPSLTKIHADLCWVIYYAQKDLLDIHLQKQIDPRQLIEHIAPYKYLFDPSIITQLTQAIDQAQSEADAHLYRSMRYLLVEYGGMFENYNRMVAFQISRSTKRIKIPELDNQKITIPQAYSLTFDQNIPRETRIIIFNKYGEYYLKQSQIFIKVLLTYQKRAELLGFSTIYDMYKDTLFFDLDEFETQIIRFLENSNEIFQKKLKKHLIEEKIEFSEAHIIDLRNLTLRIPIVPKKGKKILNLFEFINKSLGLNCNPLNIDFSKLKSKERPFAGTLINPETKISKSYLFFRGDADALDWKSFLHEVGHIYHFNGFSPDLPLINKMTGEMATTEFIAFLFEKMYSQKDFIDFIGLNQNDAGNLHSLLDIRNEIKDRNIMIQNLNQINIIKNPINPETIYRFKTKFSRLYSEYFGIQREGFDFLTNVDYKFNTHFDYSRSFFAIKKIYHLYKTKIWRLVGKS